MDYKTYQERVLNRASHRWHHDKLDRTDLRFVMAEFIQVGIKLDAIKKSLMYGRDYNPDNHDYTMVVAVPSPVPSEQDQRIIHAALGIATEGVELIEACFAVLFSDAPFDHVNLQEEFGDAEWYRALGLDALGQTHEANLEQNDAKLEKRFGKTFNEDAANNRDLDTEREVLEHNNKVFQALQAGEVPEGFTEALGVDD